ncbi:hypothetical protein [Nonomuraea sp. NPDC049784]|uniref:hypothetical protein n=1 Tax=Nonomuraea sp. NPDC049784 TaxID=3154361 RepID=UPI0033FBE685
MRTIALDTDTAQVLRAHRQQQPQERLAMGEAWTDSGFVFTQPDGSRLHPRRSRAQAAIIASADIVPQDRGIRPGCADAPIGDSPAPTG